MIWTKTLLFKTKKGFSFLPLLASLAQQMNPGLPLNRWNVFIYVSVSQFLQLKIKK